MRTILGLIVSAVLVVLSGCGPSVADEELGAVVPEVPKVEEGEEPYELPHVPAPAGFDQKANKAARERM